MRRSLIAAAAVLGLGAVTIAVAQPGTDASKAPPRGTTPPASQTCERVEIDRVGLHARVAKLRAEVELLEMEHDAIKTLVTERLRSVVVTNADLIDDAKIAVHYMRLGAEKVGKADEFDKAIQEDRAGIEKAIGKVRETATELTRNKQEFLQLSTELNQKKIELVELETKLDGSM